MSIWTDSDRVVWIKTAIIILVIIFAAAKGLNAQEIEDLESDSFNSDKKIYLVKDISTGSSIQPYFIYRSGDLIFYRNLQTGEGFKTLWVK